MLTKVRKAIRDYKIRNVIFFGASELKTLYLSFLGFDLNVIVRHGTTKSTPKRGWIHRRVYSCVDYHVTLSQHLLENVKTFVPLSKGAEFRVITSSFDPTGVKRSAGSGKAERPLRIIHVGRVVSGKGQIDAVLACRELMKNQIDFHMDLLGGFQNRKYLNRLTNEIEKSGLSENVVLHGHVDNVEDYMQTADIFLFPSYGEGMPNAMIEALHYGHICLCYSNTVFPEFKKMGFYVVLAKDRDREDLAVKLVGIASNINEERKRSESNVDLALQYFDQEREREDWLTILD